MAVDESKLNEFLGRALIDLGGAVNAVLMSIGDELGLYKALAKGPQSPAELARNYQHVQIFTQRGTGALPRESCRPCRFARRDLASAGLVPSA